jgi:hypothetical protein
MSRHKVIKNAKLMTAWIINGPNEIMSTFTIGFQDLFLSESKTLYDSMMTLSTPIKAQMPLDAVSHFLIVTLSKKRQSVYWH